MLFLFLYKFSYFGLASYGIYYTCLCDNKEKIENSKAEDFSINIKSSYLVTILYPPYNTLIYQGSSLLVTHTPRTSNWQTHVDAQRRKLKKIYNNELNSTAIMNIKLA